MVPRSEYENIIGYLIVMEVESSLSRGYLTWELLYVNSSTLPEGNGGGIWFMLFFAPPSAGHLINTPGLDHVQGLHHGGSLRLMVSIQ